MIRSIVCLFFLCFTYQSIHAQSTENVNHDLDAIRKKVDTAYYYADRDIEKTWFLSKQIIKESIEFDYPNGLGQGWFAQALYYDKTNQKDSALICYQRSANVFKNDNSPMNLAYCYNSLGVMYRQLKNLDLALEYNLLALNVYTSLNDSLAIADSWNNIANVYQDTDSSKSDKAFEYYVKAEQMYEKLGVLSSRFSIHINLGIEYEGQRNFDKAKSAFSNALRVARKNENIANEISARVNFSYLYALLYEFEDAEKHLTISYTLAHDLNILEEQLLVADAFINLRKREEKYKQALDWTNVRKEISDHLYQQHRNEFLVETEAKINLTKKEKEIKQLILKEKANKEQRIILIVSASILFLLLLILLHYQKIRHTNEKKIESQKKELLNTQLENTQLEKEKIEADLNNRKKLLSNLAIHMVQKNEMLEGIEKEITKIAKSKGNIPQELLSLKTDLKQQLRIGKDIEEFNFQLQIINESFFKALEYKLPDLTKNEKKLAALLRLGLSTKEIAISSKSTESAIKIARHRLRKKLDIASDTNLNDFFKSLEM